MAGCQYAWAEAGSSDVLTKLNASGVRFQEAASASDTTATGSGRHCRRDNASTATGTAT